jgi:glycosyltransferase involved in cell wall biosynthesis
VAPLDMTGLMSAGDPGVSVVIPTHHRETQLLEAIRSVLAQRRVSFEVIVVDDSAAGSAREVVTSLHDPRVRYILRSEPSRGRPALVRNDGAKSARGRYLYFLDDDDLLEPDTLLDMSQALDATPSAGMAFGVVEPFGTDAGVLRHNIKYFHAARRVVKRLRGTRGLGACLVFRSAVLVNSACMARRAAFFQVGGYDADIPVCEDADLWARIAQATGHVFIDRPVVRYRTGAPSLMHNLVENDTKLAVSYRRIQHKYRQENGALKFLAAKFWARCLL